MGGYGLHHGLYYGKREAEAAPKAEADPYLLYGGVYGLGYRGYGYGLHHGLYYGKREAEAAPKAEADPYLMVDMVLDMVILATATVLATGDTTGDKLPTPLQDLNHRRKTLTLFV